LLLALALAGLAHLAGDRIATAQAELAHERHRHVHIVLAGQIARRADEGVVVADVEDARRRDEHVVLGEGRVLLQSAIATAVAAAAVAAASAATAVVLTVLVAAALALVAAVLVAVLTLVALAAITLVLAGLALVTLALVTGVGRGPPALVRTLRTVLVGGVLTLAVGLALALGGVPVRAALLGLLRGSGVLGLRRGGVVR